MTLFPLRPSGGLRACAVALPLLLILLGTVAGSRAAERVPEAPKASADELALQLGRRIYREGLGTGDRVIVAQQGGGAELRGKQAACIGCHRASGMGAIEGNVIVPPISGRYLFPAPGDIAMSTLDPRGGKGLNQKHAPYDAQTLQRALSTGVDVRGRPLSAVMPKFTLDATELAALQTYLAALSQDYSPGAEATVVRFAAVVTPDVSPERRAVFEQMLRASVRAKNASTAPQHRYMTSAAAFVTRSDRKWKLDIWELTGPPETWPAQLEARYRAAPPFALLSGLSGERWDGVHEFCNRQQLPCWFPSIPAPVDAKDAGYNVYFSAGAVLEARVLAEHLAAEPGSSRHRVVQIYAHQSVGASAAATLRQSLAGRGRDLSDRELGSVDADTIRRALANVGADDVLVFWLAAPPAVPIAGHQAVYLSGSLLGAHYRELSPALKSRAKLLYPYELPQRREANLAYLQAWLKLQNIPLVDEVMQSEVFFALNFMTDVMQDMLDNLYRDYLIERAEDMLGQREAGKAEQESRDRVTLGRPARAVVIDAARGGMKAANAPDAQTAQRLIFALDNSEGTTVYPHLTLGPGQRFASKGAYIAHFSAEDGTKLVADSEWIVP